MLPYGDLYLSFDNNTNGIAHQSSHYSWTRLKITATSPKKQWVKWSSIQVDFFQSIWLVVRFLWCNDCHFAWFWWCLCLRKPSKSLLFDNRSKPLWLVRDMTRSLHSQHDDVIKWKHFPRNWPFVRKIHRSPVNFPHKGQWRGALMFSLIYVWINDWANNREAGDLRRQHGHYDVIVMVLWKPRGSFIGNSIEI